MAWWLWLVLGIALLASEAFTPGTFFLFSLLSVLSVAFLRGPLLRRIMPVRREGLAVDALVGEVAVPLEDLAPGAVGKAELRGTAWTAKNVDARPLARGERSVVRSEEHTSELQS